MENDDCAVSNEGVAVFLNHLRDDMKTSDDQAALEEYCKGMYRRTRAFWDARKGKYPTWKCRFSILYGPPKVGTDIMIVGSNPGFDPNDLYDEEIQSWPSKNEYWTRNWPLAVKLRQIFSATDDRDRLRDSVGTNLLFFKSRSLGSHKSGLGWANNPRHIRAEMERFCRREVWNLVRAVRPKLILVLGLAAFDKIVETPEKVILSRSDEGAQRRIFAAGAGFGRRVIGMIHPTGARVSSADWDIVTFALRGELERIDAFEDVDDDAEKVRQHVAEAGECPPSGGSPAGAQGKGSLDRSDRGAPLRPWTVIEATAVRPTASVGYQPIVDFWHELKRVGPVSIEDFHNHMVSIGWRRPRGQALTYEVTRIDLASMCKKGFARRVGEEHG